MRMSAREANRAPDRKLHLPSRRAQDQHVVGRVIPCQKRPNACRRRQQDQHGARHQRGQPDPCWQHMCWQHMCCQHTCWQQAWAVLNAIQQLRAAYYICIFLYIAAESRATAPLCWQHMCWSKDRHRAHFERRAQRRQSGRAVRWSTASTTNCIFPSSLLHKP